MPNSPETWITTSQAASLMGISPVTVIKRINEGKLIGKQSSDLPFDINGKPSYLVLLEHLPQNAQYKYQLLQINKAETLSIDLISPKETYGELWLHKYLDMSALLSEAARIRKEYHSAQKVTEQLNNLAQSHGISLRTLYRYEGKNGSKEISKLWLDPFYLSEHMPKTMCLLSCDFAYYLLFSGVYRYSQNDIYRELQALKDQFKCSNCVYRQDNPDRDKFSKKDAYPLPVCRTESNFMKVPSTRYPLNDLLSHIPEQQIYFCREGFRAWNAEYGHFVIRNKPQLVNLNWQGDHHVFDCFVRVKQLQTKNGVTEEKEVLKRPVLTAWMDTASGCIVGWVISILPNSSTIAEAFCRAVCYTNGDIFHGLPASVLVDCGKDYKSSLLENISNESNSTYENGAFLSQRFAGMGVLPALNVSVYHALPYHPQSKSIERAFEELEKWIKKVPGYCYNSVKERPTGFGDTLKKQHENGELYTMEEFVNFFRTKVLPEYHGSISAPDSTSSEIDNWHKAKQSMTPLELYNSLPKARNLTPNWRTMSILKMQRKNGCKVDRQGIQFHHILYWDETLAWYIGDTVDILYNAPICKEDHPLSITVTYQGRFICEAEPARHYMFTNEPFENLQPEFDSKNQHIAELRATYERIYHVMKQTGLDEKEGFRRETYAAAIDAGRDSNLASDLTEDIFAETKTEDSLNSIYSGEATNDTSSEVDSNFDKPAEDSIQFKPQEFRMTNSLLFGDE